MNPDEVPSISTAEEAKRMWEIAKREMKWEPKLPGHLEVGYGGSKSRTPTGDELRRLGLVVCDECGAVMADTVKHMRWHAEARAQREEFIVLVRSVRAEMAEPVKRVDELAAEVVKAMALMETVMEAIEEED